MASHSLETNRNSREMGKRPHSPVAVSETVVMSRKHLLAEHLKGASGELGSPGLENVPYSPIKHMVIPSCHYNV